MLVNYYEERGLFSDPLILEWNVKFGYKSDLSSAEMEERKRLELLILAYRKPAFLFDSFRESRMVAMRCSASGVKTEIVDVYDRYPTGYNFRDEAEWRVVSHNDEFLAFEEKDLSMVITPDELSRTILNAYFRSEWKVQPTVCVFPML